MIPLQLKLTHFLSYREESVVDFRDVHLASITGANGAGKSSLLDAITWSLFGKSRSRLDEDLVNRLAADNEAAEVELTFDMEGVVYRVIRRKRRGKSSVKLEFQVLASNGENDTWKTLSESHVRETQKAIAAVLRMNYDVFVNASFFLQGEADAFTTRTPAKRKEILAEVLGVTQWEEYRERVADERKEVEQQRTIHALKIEDIEQELQEEDARRENLERISAEEEQLREQLNTHEKIIRQARQTNATIVQQEEQLVELRAGSGRTQVALDDTLKSRQDRVESLGVFQTLLADSEKIEADYQVWQAADRAFQEWQEKLAQVNDLQQRVRPLEIAIAREQTSLQQQLEELEKKEQTIESGLKSQTRLEESLTTIEQEIVGLVDKYANLIKVDDAWTEAGNELQILENQRSGWQQERDQLRKAAGRIQDLTAEKKQWVAKREFAANEFISAKEQLEDLEKSGMELANLQADMKILDNKQKQRKEEMVSLRQRIDQLSAESGAECPLCDQPLTIEHRQTIVNRWQQEGDALAVDYRDTTSEVSDIKLKIEQAVMADNQRPAMQTEIDKQQSIKVSAEARLQEIEQQILLWQRGDEAFRLAELEDLLKDDSSLVALRSRIAEFAGTKERLRALEQERRVLENNQARMTAELNAIIAQNQRWQEQEKFELQKVGHRLETQDFAVKERTELAGLQKELSAVGYSSAEYEQVRTRRDELQEADGRYRSLKEAEAAVNPLRDSLNDLEERQRQLEQELARQGSQIGRLTEQIELLKSDAVDLGKLEDELQSLREAHATVSRAVGAAQQKVSVLDESRQHAQAIREQLDVIDHQIQRLKQLENACGKKGVPALLIEHALPDIEDRANELLDKLTDGAMNVSFETQRQLKSGDLSETLDIHISDNAGRRPYENYSGGERFRINFAVRLALSQVLAHRAGAQLRTLVIDEGFGSQDPEGRQRLIQAINAVQDDFACILVITHIEELRDAFPTRIEVEKSGSGSRVVVVTD